MEVILWEVKKINYPICSPKETTRRNFLRGTVAAVSGAVSIAAAGDLASREAHAQAAPPAPRKEDVMRFLFAERENCTGCRACEYACSVYHTGVVRPSLSRIHVMKFRESIDVPIVCWHCDDAPCVAVCPTMPKSIGHDPNHNGIILNEETCVACLKCQNACPAQFIRANPDTGQPLMCDMCAGDCPVENVSWDDVQKFIKKLNTMEGTDKYRLPTEAEWEYAARAGTTTRFYSGDNDGDLLRDGWYGDNAGGDPHPAAQKIPNALGLYDMYGNGNGNGNGNVWEWVQDRHDNYPTGSVTDPEGPSSGSYRVLRGGSWSSYASYCRSAFRDSYDPGNRDFHLGFRLLMTR